MRRISSNSESGAILAIVIILMLALTITGIAFLNAGVMENRLASREVYKNKAFYIAEGGLERTIWNLKQDFVNGTENWTDGDINGVSVDEGSDNILLYDGSIDGSVGLGEGSYLVKLQYVDDGVGGYKNDEIWVRSTGTVNNIPRTVQIYVAVVNLFPWNNAIFAGIGAGAGAVIEGNSLIHGSVLILGKGIEEEVMIMELEGKAGIRNNYNEGDPFGIPPYLAAKVPELPTITFNGETVESLDAYLRVKRGQVGLGGTSSVGEADETENSLKETMDGVFVTDGFDTGVNPTENFVFSDNGFTNPYNLGDTIEFPSLLEGPYTSLDTGFSYPTYLKYLEMESLHISVGAGNDIETSEISFAFDYGSEGVYGKEDPYGAIGWYYYEEPGESQAKDREKVKLEIEGIVWIEAGSLDIGQIDRTLEYSGSGTIVVASPVAGGIAGSIMTHGHVVAEGNYDGLGGTQGFPNNALGIITGDLNVGGDESQRKITGAFFAENTITSPKQNQVAGTFVSNYFDMGHNVPSIYQVPALGGNLPPGMPGGTPIWHISTSQWSES